MPIGKFIDYSIGWNTIEKEIISEEKLKEEKKRDADKEMIKKTRKLLKNLKTISDEINSTSINN